MGGIHVYFRAEEDQIARKMPHGELSKICNAAVREWAGNFLDLKSVTEEIEKEEKEETNRKARIGYLKKKRDEFKIEEEMRKNIEQKRIEE